MSGPHAEDQPMRTLHDVYVCPQCGPDPAGAWEHTQTHHVWHGGEGYEQAALNDAADALEALDTLPAVGDPRDWKGAVVEWLRARAREVPR